MWSGISGAPPPGTQWGATAQQPVQAAVPAQQQQKHDIFVGNLAFTTTEEHLHQAFSEIGRIIKVRMVTDLETQKPRGFAFIEFEDPQAALSAIRNMNDYELNGRKIRVNFSNSSHLETLAGKLGMDMTQHTQSKKLSSSNTAVGNDGVIAGGGNAVADTSVAGSGGDNNNAINGRRGNEVGSEAVASALRSMSKGEMYDVIKNLKEVADKDPDEARKLISGHPQLPEAILFLMGKLDMITNPVSSMDITLPPSTATTTNTVVPPIPDAPPPPGIAPARIDPRASSKGSIATAAAKATTTTTTTATVSRPADPRARSADPRANLQQPAQQPQLQQPPVQPQTQQQQPALPLPLPPHHMGAQVPPPTLAPPPPPFGMAVPPPNTTATVTPTSQQQQQIPPPQQQPPPPVGNASMSVAGLDPKLVEEVMSLTSEQIAQLPPDKQQGILALRQQITKAM